MTDINRIYSLIIEINKAYSLIILIKVYFPALLAALR